MRGGFAFEEARTREATYDWAGAIQVYQDTLVSIPPSDHARRGEILERIALARFRAAFQAEDQPGFAAGVAQAIEGYREARKTYDATSELGVAPRALRCEAMEAYAAFWKGTTAKEKRSALDRAWGLTKDALKGFRETDQALEFGQTYNELFLTATPEFTMEWDFERQADSLKEPVELGEQAIDFLIRTGSPRELARAYMATAGCLELYSHYFMETEESESLRDKASDYWRKARDLSRETALLGLSQFVLLGIDSFLGWESGTVDAIQHFEEALELARRSGDRFVIGAMLDFLTFHTLIQCLAVEGWDERMSLSDRGLQYADEARRHYAILGLLSPRGAGYWVEAPEAEQYRVMASWQSEPSAVRELLDRALELAPVQLRRANECGTIGIVLLARHVFSLVLVAIARIEINPVDRRRFLEEALAHRKEVLRLEWQLSPSGGIYKAVHHDGLAEIASELAKLSKEPAKAREFLEEAVTSKETAVKLVVRELPFLEKTESAAQMADLGLRQIEYGGLLRRLHALTNDPGHIRQAAEAYEHAVEWFHKTEQPVRAAESFWKTAQAYEAAEDYRKAAEAFTKAADAYRTAGGPPQVKDLHEDHGRYMEAWSEIERARYHHSRQEYGSARAAYEKAATLHAATKRWSYLAPNYAAWGQMEKAEDLSRAEKEETSGPAFAEAASLFEASKTALSAQVSRLEDAEEKRMVSALLKAIDVREAYCRARIVLEQARVLDRQGDQASSSEKYGLAAEKFETIAGSVEPERARSEFRHIATLAKAWQIMANAELEASAELYRRASELFERARDLSPNEHARTLALGHREFCKALEAAALFAGGKDVALHTAAIQHLEMAASYYAKAGLKNASEYAKASRFLFDAYVTFDEADREKDQAKRARLYMMVEKILQTSSAAFARAGHPGKQAEVLRLSERAKEARQLAMSLTAVLRAPIEVSSFASFAAPGSTDEEAVGSERFEHADVHARMEISNRTVRVGEELRIEIELVNQGRGSAKLTKVEAVVPRGFDLVQKPEGYRVDGESLDPRGKRLGPLGMTEIRLALKPKIKGEFAFVPRIVYTDESGSEKAAEVDPVEIRVREMGLAGWLKGPE